MIQFLVPLKGALVLSGIAMASAGLGTLADTTIAEDSHITLGSAVAAMSVVVGGAWYLSGKLRGINDQQRATNKRLIRIEHRLKISEDDSEGEVETKE